MNLTVPDRDIVAKLEVDRGGRIGVGLGGSIGGREGVGRPRATNLGTVTSVPDVVKDTGDCPQID
jgi:hypothetical protein